MVKTFWLLLSGCSTYDLCAVFNSAAFAANIFALDTNSRSAYKTSSLPWPVAVTLGAYSKKHIFSSSRCIPVGHYLSSINSFYNRTMWRMHLGGGTQSWYSKFKGTRPCSAFRGICAPEVSAFCNTAKYNLTQAIQCSSKGNSNNTTLLKFHKYSFDWLKTNNLHVALSDKDGGFVLVDNGDISSLVVEKLAEPHYSRVCAQDFNTANFKLVLHRNIRSIADAFDDKDLGKHLHRQLSSGDWSKVVGKVLFTIKTHKDPGDVSCRIIHSGTGNPTAPLAKFLVFFLRGHISKLPHLFGSSEHLLKDVQSRRFPNNIGFYEFDTADFLNARRSPVPYQACIQQH